MIKIEETQYLHDAYCHCGDCQVRKELDHLDYIGFIEWLELKGELKNAKSRMSKIEELEMTIKTLYVNYKTDNFLSDVEEDFTSGRMKYALRLIQEIKSEQH